MANGYPRLVTGLIVHMTDSRPSPRCHN